MSTPETEAKRALAAPPWFDLESKLDQYEREGKPVMVDAGTMDGLPCRKFISVAEARELLRMGRLSFADEAAMDLFYSKSETRTSSQDSAPSR